CAVLLAGGGGPGTLPARPLEQAKRRARERENREYLPGVQLPSQVRVEPASGGIERSDYVFLAVPSRELPEVIPMLQGPDLPRRCAVVSLAKGLVPPAGLPPTRVLGEIFGPDRVACVGGPAHAREMVREGAALVAASSDEGLARTLALLFTRAGVVCEQSDDPLGVELAGAAKNAAALAAGATEARGRLIAGELPLDGWVALVRATVPPPARWRRARPGLWLRAWRALSPARRAGGRKPGREGIS